MFEALALLSTNADLDLICTIDLSTELAKIKKSVTRAEGKEKG